MKKHILLSTNVETSRLGFGCVQLTAHDSRKEALSVLEHAFSLGITHFDVARAYGFGRATRSSSIWLWDCLCSAPFALGEICSRPSSRSCFSVSCGI